MAFDHNTQTASEAALLRWMESRRRLPDEQRAQIIGAYQRWQDTPRHIFMQTDKPAADETHLVALSVLSHPQDDKPRVRIWANDKSMAKFYSATMRVEPQELETPLRLGYDFLTHDRLYDRDGRYEHEHTPTKFIQEVVGEPAASAADVLLAELVRIRTGKDFGKNHYVWLPEKVQEQFRELQPALIAEEARRIRKTYHQFLRAMDQDALALMRKARTSEGAIYMWLTGRREGQYSKPLPAAKDEALRNRQQAFSAFPLLGYHYACDRKLTADIDAGKPLIPAIQASLNERQWRRGYEKTPVTAEFLRQQYGKRFKDVDPSYKWAMVGFGDKRFAHDFPGDMWFFSSLPREWRPVEPAQWAKAEPLSYRTEEWRKFTGRSTTDILRDFSVLVQGESRFPRVPVLAKPETGAHTVSPHDLKSALAKVSAAHTLKKVATRTLPGGRVTPAFLSWLGEDVYHRETTRFIRLDYGNTVDFIKRCTDQVGLPALVQACDQHKVDWFTLLGEYNEWSPGNGWMIGGLARHMFKGATVTQIFRASQAWHRQVGRMENQISRYNEPSFWPALFEPLQAPGGVRLHCLTSTAALQREGEEMDHCVGGYTYQCMFQGSHIVALTAKDGRWRTTMELTALSPGRVAVKQHYLKSNDKNLPEEARVAQQWLVEGLQERKIAANWPEVEMAHQQNKELLRKHQKNALLLRIGFDPANTEDADNAYARWQKNIPDILRQKTRAEMLSAKGIDVMLKRAILQHKQALARRKQRLTNE